MNTVELQKVVDLLRSDKIPVERFDMSSWKCGSCACAVGWYCTVYPDVDLQLMTFPHEIPGLRPYIAPQLTQSDGVVLTHFPAVASHFDIDEASVEYLFDFESYAGCNDYDWAEDGCLISRKTVANRIEAFIASGGVRPEPDKENEADEHS